MKHFRKLIAVILTVILVSSLALPTVVFAAGEVTEQVANGTVDNDHTTPDDFIDQMTNPDGSINWKELPKVLFDAALLVTLVEIIINAIRTAFDDIFGTIAGWLPDLEENDNSGEVPPVAEPETEAATA